MPLPNCLQRRGSTYWLRRRVPDTLRSQIGKTEIKRSLKTADLAEAKRRLVLELVKVQAEFDEAQRRLQPASLADLVEDISEQEAWSLAAQWFVAAEKKQQILGAQSVDEERLVDFDHLKDFEDTSTLAFVHSETKRFLAERNLQYPPSSSAFRRVERLLHEALVESEKRQIVRFLPSAPLLPNPRFQGLTERSVVEVAKIVTLKDLIARFRSDRGKRPKSPKTKLKQLSQDRLFLELLGADTPVDQIGREQARRVQQVIARLPPNWTKRFAQLPITEVERMPIDQLGAPMATATANSYLTAFGALMEFAVNEHLVTRSTANGLRLAPAASRVKPRLPFTADELTRIFSAPLYTGCVDDMRRYRSSGVNRPRRSRFWIPLIALFSGMRLNEICQLCEDDITVEDGVAIILIRSTDDGSKRVK
ncbi:MAG: integrase family protein, partial [Hyphomicrobiales bacterium]|nr:integrase family protein [Hyphomicrobiales bacterium]